MTLKEQLLDELQKLRQSRERPFTKQTPKSKLSKKDKLLEEAMSLLESVKEED